MVFFGFSGGLGYNTGHMRTVITGQIGMDKKPYLEEVSRLAGERGGNIEIFKRLDIG